jgi:hypothetical protein
MFPADSAFRASWTVQTPSGVPLVLAYFAERRYTNVFGTDLLFGESVRLVAALSEREAADPQELLSVFLPGPGAKIMDPHRNVDLQDEHDPDKRANSFQKVLYALGTLEVPPTHLLAWILVGALCPSPDDQS